MKHLLYAILAVAFGQGLTPDARAQWPDLGGRFFQPARLSELGRTFPHIVVLEVGRIDRGKSLITFKKMADLKGRYPVDEILLDCAGGFKNSEAQLFLEWAGPGRIAVGYCDGSVTKLCVGIFWCYAAIDAPDQWVFGEGLPSHTAAYCGPVDKLREHVAAILAGKEVILPVQDVNQHPWKWSAFANPLERDWLYGEKGRVLRVRDSLWISDPDRVQSPEESPYFVGSGVGGPEVIPALRKALRDPSPFARAEAAGDLAQLGPEARSALPALRELLHDPDIHVRVRTAAAVAMFDAEDRDALGVLVAALRDSEGDVRSSAIGVLGCLGRTARTAVPSLIPLLKHDRMIQVRACAAWALGSIGPEALPSATGSHAIVKALVESLRQDREDTVRRFVAQALQRFGVAGWLVLSELRAAVGDPNRSDWSPALSATDVLGRLGAAAVPAWMDALQSANEEVRCLAATYLGDLGPVARAAGPDLQQALRSESRSLRLQAAAALLRIDHERWADAVVAAMVRMANEAHDHDCYCEIVLLGSLGPAAKAAVPVLCDGLREKNAAIRCAAVEALGQIGPAAWDASPFLRVLLGDEVPRVRLQAARALWQIEPGCPATVPALVAMLENEEPSNTWAIEALGELGPAARTAAPVVRKALRADDLRYRSQAALALWRIERPRQVAGLLLDLRQEALCVLIAMLRESDPDSRTCAAVALASVGPEAAAAVPALIDALTDKDVNVRACVAEALGKIGPSARAAVPDLQKALKDRTSYVRQMAAQALWRVERQPHPLVLILARQLDADATRANAELLGEMGPSAREAVPALLRALGSDEYQLYRAAADALKKIDPAAAARAGLP